MAWTTPGTAVAGDVLTAAFWNANVRDNMNDIRTTNANVQQTTLTTKPSTTSSTNVDITSFSVSITPSSTSSKVLIFVAANFGTSAADVNAFIRLLRNSTAIHTSDDDATYWLRSLSASGNVLNFPNAFVYLDSPSTTSATTYKLQWRTSGSGTVYLNRRGFDEATDTVSSIVAMEIVQ